MGGQQHPGSMALLHDPRAELTRLRPDQAWVELQHGARLVDVRPAAHRSDSRELPGALVIDLAVLPRRLDPGFEYRIPEAVDVEQRWIIICRHGSSSSVAAWTLRRMGLHRTTDVIGGYEAWVAAGLPTTDAPADVRE